MKENNITRESLTKTNDIISKMESHSFHNHYHILYDICNQFENEITYLEIGCFAGGSASLVSSHPLVRNVYSIDLGRPIDKTIPIRNVNKFKNQNCNYKYFQGNSTDPILIDTVIKEVKEVDILFIDGDHKWTGAISDFTNFEKIVKKNGYLIFDDYLDDIHSPEVRPTVDSIVENLPDNTYEIIGSLKYELLKETNVPKLESSNLFILKKI